jgi:hypothetical protein
MRIWPEQNGNGGKRAGKPQLPPPLRQLATLIHIVTTAAIMDAVELAQTSIHRWPAQENVIKDDLLPLGLDTNHGFAKMPVENSEGAKRRSTLQNRLATLKQWAQSASKRSRQAGKRHDGLRVQFKSRASEKSCVHWKTSLPKSEPCMSWI